ncbi:MAG: hypothetical protein R3D71_04100 [Rickettsiales bacterium]
MNWGNQNIKQFMDSTTPLFDKIGEVVQQGAQAAGDFLTNTIGGWLDKATAAVRGMEAKALPLGGGNKLSEAGAAVGMSPSKSTPLSHDGHSQKIEKSVGPEKHRFAGIDTSSVKTSSISHDNGISVSHVSLGDLAPPHVGMKQNIGGPGMGMFS